MIFGGLATKNNMKLKLRDFCSWRERKEFLERERKISLKKIEAAFVDEEKDIRCENLIGETTLPLGVAGPIIIQSSKLKTKNYYIPLATTEGALVASVNRGCKAILQSGGVLVLIEDEGITRGPVFQTKNLTESFFLKKFLEENFSLLKKEAEKTSKHLKLLKQKINIVGSYVFVRFYFDTDLAMGMNMVTIATQAMVNFIEEKTKIGCLSLAGNFDIDKKAAFLNFYEGRGIKGFAEVFLPNQVLKEVLKTTKEKMFAVWLGKNMIGSSLSGSLGYNGHFANIVAAFFAATGQDLAHVVEGSLGITTAKKEDNGLRFSIYLPAIILGMVGGGVRLATKKEALSIIGASDKKELAQVLVGAVLAGEISLLASLAQGSLSCVHQKLGR